MLSIVIFGTGSCAERAWDAVAGIPGLAVRAVVDNDPKKQGCSWHGHAVVSAEALLTIRGWDYVCIASQWHAEIGAQLLGAGMAPERLAVFEPWGEAGVVAGVRRWGELFPKRSGDIAPVPVFTEDYAVLQLLKRIGFSPRVVLDVGASNGAWSANCARVFPEAEYYMVEPLPDYEQQLYDEKDSGWHRLAVAVGAFDGEVTVEIPDSRYGAFSATILPAGAGASAERRTISRRVRQRRVDSLLADGLLRPPQLVKLDVQGYESAVLEGGERLWGSTEVFMIELSLDRFWAGAKTLPEMIAFFAARGFLPFDFYHQFRGEDGLLSQIDCAFLRGDGELAREARQSRNFRT
jgi:FkbM family methyltransferase